MLFGVVSFVGLGQQFFSSTKAGSGRVIHTSQNKPIGMEKTSKTRERNFLVPVIVPNYNDTYLLPKCLSSFRQQNYPHVEIIIVDNDSVDKSKHLAEVYRVRFIELGYSYGLSVACNRGAQS